MSIKFSWRKLTLEKSIVKKIWFKLRELKKEKKKEINFQRKIWSHFKYTILVCFFPFLCVFMTQNQFPLKILGTKLTSEKNSPKQWLYSSDLAECRKWLQHLRLVYQSRMVFMVFFVCFCFTSTFVHIQTQKIQLKEAQALNTLNDIKIHYLSTYHQVINIHMYI